jgi:hypothetical protein
MVKKGGRYHLLEQLAQGHFPSTYRNVSQGTNIHHFLFEKLFPSFVHIVRKTLITVSLTVPPHIKGKMQSEW